MRLKCRNLEKTTTNKRALPISDTLEIKKECDQSTVEKIRSHTDTKKEVDCIINLSSDESSGEDMMEEHLNPGNDLPYLGHGNLVNQFQKSPESDVENTVCLRKKRKVHLQIGPNTYKDSSIFENHPNESDQKSVSEKSSSINQEMAETQSSTTVPETNKHSVKREFNREVEDDDVVSEDIDLRRSSIAETRSYIQRQKQKNKLLQEEKEVLEAIVKKLNNTVEKKDETISNLSAALGRIIK